MRDVVELLRDFLRAKALTESEVSREVRACARVLAYVQLLLASTAPNRLTKIENRNACKGYHDLGPPDGASWGSLCISLWLTAVCPIPKRG